MEISRCSFLFDSDTSGRQLARYASVPGSVSDRQGPAFKRHHRRRLSSVSGEDEALMGFNARNMPNSAKKMWQINVAHSNKVAKALILKKV